MNVKAVATFTPGNTAGILAKVATGLFQGVTEGAALVEGEAKTLCPVDTGDLKASIDTVVTRGINNAKGSDAPLATSVFGVSALISPHTPYAAYVEFGTGQRGAASAGAGDGPYGDRPGQAAQPYMRPALDNHKGEVIAIVQDSVTSAVKG